MIRVGIDERQGLPEVGFGISELIVLELQVGELRQRGGLVAERLANAANGRLSMRYPFSPALGAGDDG